MSNELEQHLTRLLEKNLLIILGQISFNTGGSLTFIGEP